MKHLIFATLLVLSMIGTGLHAQTLNRERPVDLRVTGALLAADTPKQDDVVTVEVMVEETPFLLRVGKVEDLTHAERTQARKHDVLLHKVRFTGAKELMEKLRDQETLGKVIAIEGWLNTTSRRFQVTAVKKGEETPPPAP
ncbi:MAG: hypothetical protein AB7G75_11970 [Candidatus Binatia bacterium]